MATEIVVPRLGWSMDEGTFVEWLKADGEIVNAGDMLFVLEGEKAAQEVESFDAGILHIPVEAPQAGDTVLVSQVLGFLLEEGETPPEYKLAETPVSPAVDEPAMTTPRSRVPELTSKEKTALSSNSTAADQSIPTATLSSISGSFKPSPPAPVPPTTASLTDTLHRLLSGQTGMASTSSL